MSWIYKCSSSTVSCPCAQTKLQQSQAALRLSVGSLEQQLAAVKQALEAEQVRNSELKKHLSSQTRTCAKQASQLQSMRPELEAVTRELEEGRTLWQHQLEKLRSTVTKAETQLQSKNKVQLAALCTCSATYNRINFLCHNYRS